MEYSSWGNLRGVAMPENGNNRKQWLGKPNFFFVTNQVFRLVIELSRKLHYQSISSDSALDLVNQPPRRYRSPVVSTPRFELTFTMLRFFQPPSGIVNFLAKSTPLTAHIFISVDELKHPIIFLVKTYISAPGVEWDGFPRNACFLKTGKNIIFNFFFYQN